MKVQDCHFPLFFLKIKLTLTNATMRDNVNLLLFPLFSIKPRFDVKENITPKRGLVVKTEKTTLYYSILPTSSQHNTKRFPRYVFTCRGTASSFCLGLLKCMGEKQEKNRICYIDIDDIFYPIKVTVYLQRQNCFEFFLTAIKFSC